MYDIRANGRANMEIVAEIERMLQRARAGQIKAIALVAIDSDDNGDAAIKMRPEAILVPAIIGSMDMLKDDLIALQREQLQRRAG